MDEMEEEKKKIKEIKKNRLIHLGINCILYLFGIVLVKYINNIQLGIYISFVFLPLALLVNLIIYFYRIKIFDYIYIVRSLILLAIFIIIRFGKYGLIPIFLFIYFIFTLEFLTEFKFVEIGKLNSDSNIKEDEIDTTTKLVKNEDKNENEDKDKNN